VRSRFLAFTQRSHSRHGRWQPRCVTLCPILCHPFGSTDCGLAVRLTRAADIARNHITSPNRFGEYDETMTAEERMLQRFQHERMKRHERSGAFNLPDPEESLTHGGQVRQKQSRTMWCDLGWWRSEHGSRLRCRCRAVVHSDA
jgi:hypothetical protein